MNYENWLEEGKLLVAEHDDNKWDLGDWIVRGDNEWNIFAGIPRYCLIHKKNDGSGESYSERLPNFYKDVAAAVGLAVQTLKNLAVVARAFPPDERHPRLSWSHHREAAPYERAQEYLAAAADVAAGQRVKSTDWLATHIRECEGKDTKAVASLSFTVPADILENLHLLAKYENQDIRALAAEVCLPALREFLAARNLNLAAARVKPIRRTRAGMLAA